MIASATGDGGVVGLDELGRVQYADEQAARLLGGDADALAGAVVFDLVAEGWREIAQEQLARARAGQRARFDLRLHRSDDGDRWVEVMGAPAFELEGRFLGAVWILFDVTGRKQTQRERDESEARLRAAFDNFPFDFWVTDVDGRYLLQNAVSIRNWGDHVGRTPREAGFPPEVADEFERNNRRALAGEVVDLQSEYERDGQRRYVDKIIAPVLVGDEVRGTLGVNIDVTERRRLEAQLARSERLDVIGRLAGGISHDFNNILTTIMMCAYTLGDRLPAVSSLQRDVNLIKGASSHAASLTRQLLTFARRQPVRPEVIDVDELLLGVDAMLRRVLGEDVQLETLPGAAAPVLIDPSQLEQVLVNLATNARQAMPHGGALVIRTENVRLVEPLDSMPDDVPPGVYVVLAMTDTGAGMDERTLQRAFEPFFTGRADKGGTGLGLASSYGIVAQAGGYVTVRSAPGQGTEFRIYLPPSSDAVAPADRPRAAAPLDLGRYETILVVEDEPTVRDALADILTEHRYRVIPARGGDEAFARARAEPINLLVTDVVMPLMSGPDLAARLRADNPALPVLFMSGYATDRSFQEEVGRGAAQFLAKPFTPRQLAQAVRAALDAPAVTDS